MIKYCAIIGLIGVTSLKAHAKMIEAEFVLVNHFSKTIRVVACNKAGKMVAKDFVKPGGELALRVSRRIIVYVADESREYALPSALYLWSPDNRLVATLGGKWRLSVTKSPQLFIQVIKAPSARLPIDVNKPPLTFPLRPRKTSESFE